MADFTISSLNSWQWASGSVYYLLGLWCALLKHALRYHILFPHSLLLALWRALLGMLSAWQRPFDASFDGGSGREQGASRVAS